MGRKAKANKGQNLMPSSPVQTSASEENPNILNSDAHLSSQPRKRKYKNDNVLVRRSRRIHNSAGNQELQPIIHEIHITESESEKEDEQPVHQVNDSPKETSNKTERETPGVADIKYKAMYINSQKKIEGLVTENQKLNSDLEHAFGKIDAYEKQSNIYMEVLAVLKSLSKVNENLSSQVKQNTSFDNNEDGVTPPAQ